VKDFLSEFAIETIRNHLLAAVAIAEEGFENGRADEDCLTGALGDRLRHRPVVLGLPDGKEFRWETNYYKIRGRGRGALEKPLGADGIFQVQVIDLTGAVVLRKGLLFQAKNEWSGSDSGLLDQARKLTNTGTNAIVVDYSSSGYFAVPASQVVEAGGNRRNVVKAHIRPLGKALAIGFLDCIVGRRGLYYDSSAEAVNGIPEHGPIHVSPEELHRIETVISQTR
jgi:hypothetical protein